MSLAQQFLAARAEHKRDKPRNRGKQTVTPTANQPLDVPTSDPLYGVAPIREQRFPAQGVGSANVVRRRLGDRTGMLPEFDAEAEMRASGLMPRDDSWLPEHWRGMEGGGELPPANPAPSLRSPTPAPAWEVASGLEPAEQFERSVPLDRESLARFAGESAALQVQPSFGDGNILDVFRGYGEGAWDAGADTISALGGNEGAQRRMNARGQWFGRAAQNGFGVPDALEGIGAAMTSSGMLDDPSNPNFIPSSQFHRWDVDRADLAMDREAENDPRYLGRAEEFVVEVPRYRGVEGAARFAGSMVDDWLGAGAFERDAEGRRRYATADAMGDLSADRGDVEGATQWDQEAQSAAGAQAFDAGFNALELAPGIGLIDVPISAGRFTGRQVARGLGREVPNVLQAPLPDVPGPLTQEGRRYVGRNLVEPAVGAGAGYALMQTGDGDAEPWAVGLGTAAGALTPGALRLGARAIGDELAAQAAAPPIDRARRMPDYPAGTRLEVRDVPFEEVAPSRQRNFEAAVQDPASLRADRARPVSYGEQVNRDGSVSASDPIDWEAPIESERTSMRDLGIGGNRPIASITDDPNGIPQNFDTTPSVNDPVEMRMARARRMGFDTETPLYHGSERQFDEFDLERSRAGLGFYLARDPAFAADFGEVRPIFTRGDALDLAQYGQWADKADLASIAGELGISASVLEQAWDGVARVRQSDVPMFALLESPEVAPLLRERHTAIDFMDLRNGGADWNRVVTDPSAMRSPDAAFDPARSNSSDLLAGIGIGALGGGGGYALGEMFDGEAQADADGIPSDEMNLIPWLMAGGGAALFGGRQFLRNARSQVGMFAGPNARTANREMLARAEEMAAQGASRDDIWSETGWFQGVDGKWRFEIDDSGAGLTPRASEIYEAENPNRYMHGERLGDVLAHDDLAQAYPDVPEMGAGAYYTHGANSGGSYHPIDDSLGISASSVEDALTGILHETQHGVQRREGFAFGGSPDRGIRRADIERHARQAYEEAGELTDDQLMWELGDQQGPRPPSPENRPAWDDLSRRQQIEWYEAGRQRAYRALAGETEARNVEYRSRFTPEERRSRPPWETQDVPDDQQIIRFDGGVAESRGTSRETASVPLDAGTNQLAEQRLNSAGNRRGVYDNNLRNGDRNAQIVDLREQFGRNAQADGGRGRRAEGSADHIAAVMRGEQPLPDGSFIETPRPEVTRSTVLGVWKRADDAARAAAPPEEAFRGLEEFGISPERARAISAQRNTDPLAIGALALGTGALALGAGEADAQGLERLDIDPDAAPPSMRSAVGSPTVYGEYYIQEFADGSRHVFRMNRQGERADPEYVGELRGTNTPSPRLGEGQGRVISEGVLETPLPPYEGEDNGEETPLWMRAIGAGVAGLTGRKITTALGGRGVLRDLNTALSAGLGDFAITGGDADPRDSLGVGLMTAGGARAFDAIAPEVAAVGRSYVREAELAASPAFRAERDAFAETLSDQPQSRVRALGGLERDPFDHYQYGEIEGVGGMVPGSEIIDEGWARDLDSASLGLGGNTGSPREQFLAAAPEEQARMIERARRSEWADPGPELPYVSPERIEQGRAAQRLVASSAPATPPIGPQAGFTEPGTGTSVFGEVKPPRAPRAPLPPLEDRAQLSGAQGAMRGVKAPTMRAMADDLGIARDGMTAGELRKSLTRALAARFDSTRELVAFLTRYGVSGAALGLAFEAERAEAASP